MKRYLVAMLLRLYPKRWRSEYGAELSAVLLGRPLGARGFLNVVASALWQQARTGEPWLIMGALLLVPTLLTCAQILAGAQLRPGRSGWGGLISGAAIFFTAGFWTATRRGSGGGRAAMKLNLLVCSPLIALGVLAAAGLVRLAGADSARESTNLLLLWYPITQTPIVGAIGWFGGLAARVTRRRKTTTA